MLYHLIRLKLWVLPTLGVQSVAVCVVSWLHSPHIGVGGGGGGAEYSVQIPYTLETHNNYM